MKRISSSAVLGLLLFAAVAAQGQDEPITGKPVPPLQSLKAFSTEQTGIEPGASFISRQESQALSSALHGETLSLPSISDYLDEASDPLEFQRVELFAEGARIWVHGPDGVFEIPPDDRHYFLASNRTTGVGLAVDIKTGQISGVAVKGSSKVQLDGQLDVGIDLQAITEPPGASNSCGTVMGDQEPAALEFLKYPIAESQSAAESGQAINYQAVIAIDTDNEWMAGKGNNVATAMTWITDAFLAMNVFFERDVETRLLIGDVTLRLTPDPYTEPSDRSKQLDEFGEYWRVNMAATDRDFAAMLSGRDVCSGCFSGIAWLNKFCDKGTQWGARTPGSYSYNAIGSGRSASGIAIYLGHEIGHNMGSPHTHCYSPAVDQCYKGESGCYSGATSCPAGGKGTVMSYCHVSGSDGAGCGTSKSEFHPTVQGLIESRLAANSPSCIAAYSPPNPVQTIFNNSFE